MHELSAVNELPAAMIKVILLVSRRNGLTRSQFRERYESGHVPLAAARLQHCVGYVRNFVTGPDDGDGPDCVTEFWYNLDGSWTTAREQVATDAIRAELAADEAEFMDRSSMRTYVVDEQITAAADLSRP
jgi:EthD domain